MEFKFHVEAYYTADFVSVDFAKSITNSVSGTANLSIDGNLPILKGVKVSTGIPGFYVEPNVYFIFGLKGQLTITYKNTKTAGFHVDTDTQKLEKNDGGKCFGEVEDKFEVSASVSGYVGFACDLNFVIIDSDIIRFTITPEIKLKASSTPASVSGSVSLNLDKSGIDFETAGKYNLAGHDGSIHKCKVCTDISTDFEININVSFSALGKITDKFSISGNILSWNCHWKDYYLSSDASPKFGEAPCPNRYYPVTVTVRDSSGNKFEDLDVFISDDKGNTVDTIKTGSGGKTPIYYLQTGKKYSVSAEKDGKTGAYGFTIDGHSRDILLTLRSSLTLSTVTTVTTTTTTQVSGGGYQGNWSGQMMSVGDIFTFGTWNGSPLEWRVLKVNGDEMTVITKDCLSGHYYDNEDENGTYEDGHFTDYFDHRYNKTDERVTWETCSLRKWLNGDFYDKTFTSDEKSHIKLSTIHTPNNPDYGTKGGNDTQDNVWLLSIDEAESWFNSYSDRVAGSMNCGWTSYEQADIWWLRSPGYFQCNAAVVCGDGIVISGWDDVVYRYDSGVRPALNLKSSKSTNLSQNVLNSATNQNTEYKFTKTNLKSNSLYNFYVFANENSSDPLDSFNLLYVNQFETGDDETSLSGSYIVEGGFADRDEKIVKSEVVNIPVTTTTTKPPETKPKTTTTTTIKPAANKYLGDPNHDGQITAEDATFELIEFAQSIADPSYKPKNFEECDVNCDGKLTAEDATAILIYFATKLTDSNIPPIDEFDFKK